MAVHGGGGAYLSGADPINHSALHPFTRTSAVRFPCREHPEGALHLSPRLLRSWMVWQSLLMFVTAHLSSPPTPLSAVFLWPMSLFFQALAASPLWHALILAELLSSDNVTIS